MGSDALRAAIRQRRDRTASTGKLEIRAREWFPKQRAFYEDRSKLVAALCSRRAGKTRGGCLNYVKKAASTQHGRYLYINETYAECQKMAWYGLRGDGMYSLVQSLGLDAQCHGSNLTIHFPKTDSWIYLMGADDEAGVRKALGLAYHEVWWDEAQKIPSKLEEVIRSVLMPTLLDYGGQLRLTGTPVRNMSGLFYSVTRGDARALKRWSVHRWNMLDNPHFGRVGESSDGFVVYGKMGDVVAGPFASIDLANEAATAERYRSGILELQELFGGAESCPIDSPIMQREGFGHWVHEDALYVYEVRKAHHSRITYAPNRTAATDIQVARIGSDDGPTPIIEMESVRFADFPDIKRALIDLPGYPHTDYFFALAADIGYRDPFAFTLVAWSLIDPVLYEVASWGRSELDQPTQAAVLRHVCDMVNVGVIAADAGGSVLPTVKGWSREWQDRYGIPIEEMEKTNKASAIAACNGDIARGRYRFRDWSPLIEQMHNVQWSSIRSGTGKLIEDPSIPNDVADTGLYAHRRSYAHRHRPTEPVPAPGTPERMALEEDEIFQMSSAAQD